jgi:hypothetical protein
MQTTSLNQLGLNRLNSQYRQQLHLVRPTSHHNLTALIHNRHHVLSPESLKNPAPISHLLVGHDFRIFSTSLLLQDTICMEGVLRVLERVPTIRIADQLRRCRVTGLSKHPNKSANPPRHKLCSTRAQGPRLVKWREWVWRSLLSDSPEEQDAGRAAAHETMRWRYPPSTDFDSFFEDEENSAKDSGPYNLS